MCVHFCRLNLLLTSSPPLQARQVLGKGKIHRHPPPDWCQLHEVQLLCNPFSPPLLPQCPGQWRHQSGTMCDCTLHLFQWSPQCVHGVDHMGWLLSNTGRQVSVCPHCSASSITDCTCVGSSGTSQLGSTPSPYMFLCENVCVCVCVNVCVCVCV